MSAMKADHVEMQGPQGTIKINASVTLCQGNKKG